jgi:aminoglycoside phosphotransferase (APT) family kinase protein
MAREFRIMERLKPSYNYVPQMIALCSDESVIGREFYVMEKISGIIPRANLPKELILNETEVSTLCKNVIDTLIELHQVDIQSTGLHELGKGALGIVNDRLTAGQSVIKRQRLGMFLLVTM